MQNKSAASHSPCTLHRIWRLLFLVTGLCGAIGAQAASQAWTNAPVDSTWTNILNWTAQAVPGALNQTGNSVNNDVATFSNAIPVSLIGSASNPILTDNGTINNDRARALGSIIFATANCGAYVFSNTSPVLLPSASNPEQGLLNLCHNGSITMNAEVVNSQTFMVPVFIRLPSSTAGIYNFVNNATSSSAVLYINTVTNDSATSRSTIFVLNGSNTGTNTIGTLSKGTTTSTAAPQGITKSGTGVWILTGTNDFLAGTGASMNINDGTLIVRNPAVFGLAASATVNSNGVLQIDGVTLTQGTLNLLGGKVRMNGSAMVNGIRPGTTPAISTTLATTGSGDIMEVVTNSGGTIDTVVHVSGPGTVRLSGAGSYGGNWSFDAGTCQLSNTLALGTGPTATVNAGGTLDLTQLGAISYGLTTAALGASGTGTAVGSTAATIKADASGVIDLATGTKAINLTYTPTSFSGDSTHPALYVSQGVLSLGGNAFTINNASGTPLGIGTYLLIQQASGSITTGGGYVADVQGSGTAPGTLGTIQVSGGNVNLVVAAYTAKNLVWTGGNPNANWDNSATPNWLNGAVAAVFNVSDSVTFNSVGSTNPTVTLVGTLSPGSATVDTSANNYTFAGSGRVAGGTGLTKINSGTLLVQTLNTYTGGTVVSNGTLSVGVDNALPLASIVTVNTPGVLDLNTHTNTIAGLAGDGTVDNTGGGTSTLIVGGNNASASFSGVIQNTSGTLGLTKVGTGVETIIGANTYTGPTFINNGTLRLGNINALNGGASPLTINVGTLDMRSDLIVSNLTGAAGTFIANNSSATINSLISYGTSSFIGTISDGTGGGGIKVYVPSGFLTLSGPNTYSGGTIVASGATLAIGVRNPGGSGTAGTGGIIASNGVTIAMPTSVTTSAQVPNDITTVDNATVLFTGGEVADQHNGGFIGGPTATNVYGGNMSIGGPSTFSNFLGTVIFTNISPNAVRFNTANVNGDNTMFIFTGGGVQTRDATIVRLGAISGTGGIYGPGVTAGATYMLGAKGLDTVYSGTIWGSNNIVKTGAGKLTFDGGIGLQITTPDGFTFYTNLAASVSNINISGFTTISNGTLKLVVPVTLSNSFAGDVPTPIILASPAAVLDATSMGYTSNEIDAADGITVSNIVRYTNSVLEIAPNQLLNGIGTIQGKLLTDVGSVLNPGYTALTRATDGSFVLTNGTGTGTLTVSDTATINGAVNMRLNLTNPQNSDRLAASSITVNGTATLVVTNMGPENAATFQLFNHAVTGFGSVVLPPTTGTNSWQNNLAFDGSITLIAPAYVNPSPTNITAIFNSGTSTLTLSWPADHLGWFLQAQTNSISVGLGTNWVVIPGSDAVTQEVIPVDPANGAVFYRMIHP